MSEIFVDRIDLQKSLKNLLEKMQNHNYVYILSGKSGYGKSAFCKHIISNIKEQYVCYRISIPIGENISLNEGLFFRAMAQQVSENAKENQHDNLEYFLKKTQNPVLRKIYNHQLLEDSGSLHSIMRPINTILSHYDSSNFFSEYNYFLPEDSRYLYLILIEYLKECFSKFDKVIINIENIHKIDRISLGKINDLLRETTNLFFLLEYTTDDTSIDIAKKFETNFTTHNTEIITKKICKLDYNNTCDLIAHMYPDSCNINNEKIFREIYITIDGNIRQLSDIESLYELQTVEEDALEVENFTLDRLKKIDNAHVIQILCLVYTHMGKVYNETLKYLINLKEYTLFIHYNDLLKELSAENGLLKIENDIVRFSHDSIAENIKNVKKFMPKIILAYNWWIELYEKLFSNSYKSTVSRRSIVIKLCYFYKSYEPAAKKLLNLKTEIRKVALDSVNPEEAISFLFELSETGKISDNSTLQHEFMRFLLDLYYELGIYNKAYLIFEKTKFDDSKIHLLYDSILKNRLQDNEKVLEQIEQELGNVEDNNHYLLCLYLIKFITAASCNQYDLCEDAFNKINDNEKFMPYLEYGFFLRNSEISLGLNEALPYLRKSINFFKKQKLSLYEAHSRISLLMNCARLGKFDEAEDNYTKAKELLQNNSLEKHILLNDWVALQMCKGNFDLQLKDNLILAMCTAQTIFDKLVINKNLLTIYAKNQYWDEGESIVELLLEYIDLETNKLNICFTYWNISYFYKHYSDELYQYYYDIYNSMYSELLRKPIRKSVIEKNVFHKPNMEFVIEFISYWHFPVPKNL